MKVKANSVTFPDGSRVGTLVVSSVTADKLPMAPPAGGAQFGVPAWTVQPAGTRFDPPIEVTLPNASSQPAGDNLPIVQWDHDLGQYVAMGRATVSEDGSVLITDSGSGITKAGWGGLCRYDPDKCGKNAPPPDCSKYLCRTLKTSADGCTSDCEKDTSKKGDKGDEISFGVGPLEWEFNVRNIPISMIKTPTFTTYGSINGQVEIQKECCLGQLQEEGRRILFKGTGEAGFEAKFQFARYPIIFTAKAAAAGSVGLEIDACRSKPPVVGELEALGEARLTLGVSDDPDLQINLVSGSGTAKAKSKWTAEGDDLVIKGTVELDVAVTLLQFKILGLGLTGVTIKVPRYESPELEFKRFPIFK